VRRCYFSKNYTGTGSGGNKAKTDMEKIMDNLGFINVGLKQTTYKNKIIGFILTLLGVIKAIFTIRKDDYLVLQYPLKKYYSFLCRITRIKGGKVITLIHDLGSFRRKRLTPDQERSRLAYTDYIIALNDAMKDWLIRDGYKQPIGVLGFWDYLSDATPITKQAPLKPYEVIYVGGLTRKRNSFMYAFDKSEHPEGYIFTVYGGGFEYDTIRNKDIIGYKGFVNSDEIIRSSTGDYGLVWYGHSIDKIDGVFGEYQPIQTPHKPSLYIRCHLPVIIWSKSALAPFVLENRIGICIDSLSQLDDVLSNISNEEYLEMKKNTIKMSEKIARGHFFTQAYLEAEKRLSASQS